MDVTETDCDATIEERICGSDGGRAALQRIQPAQTPQSRRRIVATSRKRLTEESEGLCFSGFTLKPRLPEGPGGIPPGPEACFADDSYGVVSDLHGNELPLSSLQPRLLARSSSPASSIIGARLQVASAALTLAMTSGSVSG